MTRDIAVVVRHIPGVRPVSVVFHRIYATVARGIGLNVIERLFQGFGLTPRKLLEAARMFFFLLVLGLPLLLMARRQLWLTDRTYEAAA